MMPKQVFLTCAVVLFLSGLPSVLHADVCDSGFCFEIFGAFGGVDDHVDGFTISTDKPVVELHLSIIEPLGDQFGDLTRWEPSFPPPTLSPPPDISSTLDFGSDSMTLDVMFSPTAPLPAGTYEVALLHAQHCCHLPAWDATGKFSDGSSFVTGGFVLPEPSTFALLAIVSPLLGCPFRTRRRLRHQRTQCRSPSGTK